MRFEIKYTAVYKYKNTFYVDAKDETEAEVLLDKLTEDLDREATEAGLEWYEHEYDITEG